MVSFYRLSDPQAEAPQVVGYPVSYLAAAVRQGYRVLPSLVVPASLRRQFLALVDWEEPSARGIPESALQVEAEDTYELQQVGQRLQQRADRPFPMAWRSALEPHLEALQCAAVTLRPSIALPDSTGSLAATPVSSLLNCHLAMANAEQVGEAIKALWAELFEAKSLFYWRRQGISLGQVELAVLIQPLLPAIASGVMQIDQSQMHLNAVRGLGQILASGEASPEQYQVDRATGETRFIAAQQTHAYWLTPEGSQNGTDGQTSFPTQLHSRFPKALPLEHRLLSHQGHDGVIPLPQRQQLVSLGNSLAERWVNQPFPRCVEWLLCCDRHQNKTIHIAHITPWSAAGAWTPGGDRTMAVAELSQAADATLRGIAASSGQVSGSLHRVNSPRDWVPANAIILAIDITPDWLPLLQRVAGVVTEQGGLTSHAAILTRELGIPAVVGVSGATQQLHSGDRVRLDGDRGLVTRLDGFAQSHHVPPQRPVARSPVSGSEEEFRIRPMGSFCSLSEPRSPAKTKLMLTLSHLDQLYTVTQVPIDGIGLLRSELLLLPLLNNQHPLHWLATGRQTQLIERIAACVSQIAAAVFPDPVFYRSLSLRSDEFSHLEGAPAAQERNPTLGEHGAYSYSRYPELLQTELLALRQVQQAGYSNLRLLLPFVRAAEEVVAARKMAYQTGLASVESFQLWIMAEVPSVLFLLPEYAKAGVQGIAIGSNDLTQLIFAADRNHPALSRTFQAHPALLQAVSQLIAGAKQLGLGTSLCGDLPSYAPEVIPALIEWGVEAISVPPQVAASVLGAIAVAEGLPASSD
ncbi:MAG: putative PEP-binding protein [Cyanobacteria bacterium P01_A01_bin.135]